MGSRKQIQAVYSRLYTSPPDVNDNVCFYCGRHASDMDHVPPLTFADAAGMSGLVGIKLLLIPSCSECNSLLSNKPLTTARLRAQYLVGVYAEAYAGYMMAPILEDLSDLGEGITSYAQNIVLSRCTLEQVIETLWSIDTRLYLLEDVKPLESPSSIDRKTRMAIIESNRRANAEAAAYERLQKLQDVVNSDISALRIVVAEGTARTHDEEQGVDAKCARPVVGTYKKPRGLNG